MEGSIKFELGLEIVSHTAARNMNS